MTTFIPALTLPSVVFSTPAVAILLPVAIGASIGYAVSRESAPYRQSMPLTSTAKGTQQTYNALKQPPFRPPGWVFGPAWTALYALMGYASYRAWHTGSLSLNPITRDLAKQGATLYTIQLGFNFLWMPLFFGYNKPRAAVVDILALGATTSYLTYIWSQVDIVSARCLYPYLAWLSFATYLNIGTGYLNNWDLTAASTAGKVGKKE